MTPKHDRARINGAMKKKSEPAHSRHDIGEMSFENGFEDSPPELWRVVSCRGFNGRSLRHVNWFATEEAARKHAEWINDGRGQVLSIVKYRAC